MKFLISFGFLLISSWVVTTPGSPVIPNVGYFHGRNATYFKPAQTAPQPVYTQTPYANFRPANTSSYIVPPNYGKNITYGTNLRPCNSTYSCNYPGGK